jgi:glycerol-3-phosphate O-acyltransferase
LKFEYFFAERDEFRLEMTAELEASVPGWEAAVASGDGASVLRSLVPSASSWVLRPVFEAYLVLADALVDVDFRRDADEDRLIDAALALGAQYRAQRAIRSPEAVSTVLFKNAMRLAANRDLLSGGDLSRLEEREAFAADLGSMVGLVGDVERLRD